MCERESNEEEERRGRGRGRKEERRGEESAYFFLHCSRGAEWGRVPGQGRGRRWFSRHEKGEKRRLFEGGTAEER